MRMKFGEKLQNMPLSFTNKTLPNFTEYTTT